MIDSGGPRGACWGMLMAIVAIAAGCDERALITVDAATTPVADTGNFTVGLDDGGMRAGFDATGGGLGYDMGVGMVTGDAGEGGPIGGPVDASMDGQPDVASVPVRFAALSVTPTSQGFGDAIVGGMGPWVPFTIRNTGDLDSGALALTIAGPATGEFLIQQDSCSSVALMPGASCTLRLACAPKATGSRIGQLIVTAEPGAMATADLACDGKAADNHLSIAPSFWDFGPTLVLGTSVIHMTLTNGGVDPAPGVALMTGGEDAAEFTIVDDDCSGRQIAGGASCSLGVQFRPTTTGMRSATLRITAPDRAAIVVPLQGTGAVVAPLVATPAQQDFYSVLIGLESAPVTFTITNPGLFDTAPLVAAQVVGPTEMAGSFKLTDNCASKVLKASAQNSCTVVVRMQPIRDGVVSASVVVGDGTNTVSINVFGKGLVADVGLLVTPSPIDFGQAAIGASSPPAGMPGFAVTIANLGADASGPMVISIEGGDAASFSVDPNDCPASGLESGSTCTARVRFNALSPAGAKFSMLRVGTVSAPSLVALTGVSTDPS